MSSSTKGQVLLSAAELAREKAEAIRRALVSTYFDGRIMVVPTDGDWVDLIECELNSLISSVTETVAGSMAAQRPLSQAA